MLEKSVMSYLIIIVLLQTYNEVQHCFLAVGLVYPEDLFLFLLNVSYFSHPSR